MAIHTVIFRKRGRRLVACATAALVMAAGCGEDAGDPSARDSQLPGAEIDDDPFREVDPCDLLTDDEVADAIGEAVLPGSHGDDPRPNPSTCWWTLANPDSEVMDTGVSVTDLRPDLDVENVSDIAGNQVSDSEQITGLGIDAYWNNALGLKVYVESEDRLQYFSVEIPFRFASDLSDEQRRDAAVALAALALERLEP